MQEAAGAIQEIVEDTQKGRFLTFAIGEEVYGIEIKNVTEIISIQRITEAPELPDYIKGIINLRGKIIPVLDVRLRFKKESKEYSERTCIIVVKIGDNSVGLIVDSVAEVTTITENNIVPPPDVNTGYFNKYIKGIGKVGNDVKLLLDCSRILSDEDCESLSKIS